MVTAFLAFNAREAWADYAVSIKDNAISVSIVTMFVQNITLTPTPAYNLTLSGSNATSAQSALSSALSSALKGVQASGLKISSSSNGTVTRTGIDFDVKGAATFTFGSVKFDMVWKSFKVAQDILAGGFSINTVGRYLSTSPVLGQVSNAFVQWTYLDDGTAILYSKSVGTVASFQVLDFSQLSGPVASWQHSFTTDKGITTIFRSFEHHNFTAVQSFRESESGGSAKTFFTAGYSRNVHIDVLGPARAVGDSILVDNGSFASEVMLVMMAVFPIIGIAAFLAERRINAGSAGPRRKGKRPRK